MVFTSEEKVLILGYYFHTYRIDHSISPRLILVANDFQACHLVPLPSNTVMLVVFEKICQKGNALCQRKDNAGHLVTLTTNENCGRFLYPVFQSLQFIF